MIVFDCKFCYDGLYVFQTAKKTSKGGPKSKTNTTDGAADKGKRSSKKVIIVLRTLV